ncbi:hypothetical protein UVI_02057230 [Ustilaginoidea virens]|uniref:Uncharacterized protein n=1 Tax=Ustilaginoidea virens TaxID=1159556 RepID=A0A1B5L1E2_USTVR|nr:hypothetical protein UVI_02057230 [Ustilaginoidea virens]
MPEIDQEKESEEPEDVKILIPGTLVAASTDHFQTTCYIGTVAGNNVLEDPPFVDVFWARQSDMVTDPTVELVMLEPTSGYFESLKYTMTGFLLRAYLFEPKPASVPPPQYLNETPEGQPVIPSVFNSLDESQRNAFAEATCREVAVIQGPPGTGKTFTSNAVLQSLVETQRLCNAAQPDPGPKIPIIVVAQTNNALDQLLRKFVHSTGTKSIARLGGRGSADMKEYTLSELMKKSPGPQKKPVGSFYSQKEKIVVSLKDMLTQDSADISAEILKEHGLLSESQYASITDDDWEDSAGAGGNLLSWLGIPPPSQTGEQDPPGAACLGSNRAPSRRSGREAILVPLSRPPPAETASSSNISNHLLDSASDLYDIRPEDRLCVYKHLQARLYAKQNLQESIAYELASYASTCNSIRMARTEARIASMQDRGIEVIGCTTTGLLKFRDIISGLRPRILLMEEAAEVREADTIAAALCLPSLEHFILIGDHQQLQPHANMDELSRAPYRINISMFERLIKLGIPHKTLLQQRRMIPRLRKIVQIFYPELTDYSPVVSKLGQNVAGMTKPLWWFRHDWHESPAGGARGVSVANYKEARMIVSFVQYLIGQGIQPSRITMLTYYKGQVAVLERELENCPSLAALKSKEAEGGGNDLSVRTVDGFQGEENDIIILSLVRGPNGKPGFLTSENRAIVALSRARLGLYIFGNQEVLLESPRGEETWSTVLREMAGNTGKTMPLKLKDQTFEVGSPEDLQKMMSKDKRASQHSKTSPRKSRPGRESAERNRSENKPCTEEGQGKLGSWAANVPAVQLEEPPADVPEENPELISFADSITISVPEKLREEYNSKTMPLLGSRHDWLIDFSDDDDDYYYYEDYDDGADEGPNLSTPLADLLG